MAPHVDGMCFAGWHRKLLSTLERRKSKLGFRGATSQVEFGKFEDKAPT